jgi:hypothetical protein
LGLCVSPMGGAWGDEGSCSLVMSPLPQGVLDLVKGEQLMKHAEAQRISLPTRGTFPLLDFFLSPLAKLFGAGSVPALAAVLCDGSSLGMSRRYALLTARAEPLWRGSRWREITGLRQKLWFWEITGWRVGAERIGKNRVFADSSFRLNTIFADSRG